MAAGTADYLDAELRKYDSNIDALKEEIDVSVCLNYDVFKALRDFEGKISPGDQAEDKDLVVRQVSRAMDLLGESLGRCVAHKKAARELRRELQSDPSAVDAGSLAARLRKLADVQESAVPESAKTPTGRAYADFRRDAGLSGDADDDEVQMTQAHESLTCPLTQQLLTDPVRIKPCFDQGIRCIVSKGPMEQLLRRGQNKCPVASCNVQAITVRDLVPCAETGRKLKKEKHRLERDKIRQEKNATVLEDDDALDEDEINAGDAEGVTQVD